MTTAPDEFRTDRLLARRISIADLPAMAAMNADPLVMKSLGGVLGADGSRAWVEEKVTHWREHEFGVYVLTSADGVVVGRAGLQYADVDDERCIELLYALRIEAWGNGYATEASRALLDIAFNVLGLPEVVAVVLPGTEGSRHVLRSLASRTRAWPATRTSSTGSTASTRPTGKRARNVGASPVREYTGLRSRRRPSRGSPAGRAVLLGGTS